MSSLDHERTLIVGYSGHDKCALVMSSLDHERTLIVGYSEQAVTLKDRRQKHKRPRPIRVGRGQLALS